MTRGQLIQQMKSVLLRRRDALRRHLAGELEQASPLDERGVGDSVDVAVDSDYREISSELIEVESRELAHIERALERMREGSYGICEGCGKKIPAARLQALPYATMCVQCQNRQEQGRVTDEPAHRWSRLPEVPGGSDELTFDSINYVS
jgi:DnaK suppressor protein